MVSQSWLVLCNLHAPNSYSKYFFLHILHKLYPFGNKPILLGGDFNIVYSARMDRSSLAHSLFRAPKVGIPYIQTIMTDRCMESNTPLGEGLYMYLGCPRHYVAYWLHFSFWVHILTSGRLEYWTNLPIRPCGLMDTICPEGWQRRSGYRFHRYGKRFGKTPLQPLRGQHIPTYINSQRRDNGISTTVRNHYLACLLHQTVCLIRHWWARKYFWQELVLPQVTAAQAESLTKPIGAGCGSIFSNDCRASRKWLVCSIIFGQRVAI